MSFSSDLLQSFIVPGGLCPSLGDLCARLRASPLKYSPLHKRSGSICPSRLIFYGLSSFQAAFVRAWVIPVQDLEHRHCKLAFTQTLRNYMSFSSDLF